MLRSASVLGYNGSSKILKSKSDFLPLAYRTSAHRRRVMPALLPRFPQRWRWCLKNTLVLQFLHLPQKLRLRLAVFQYIHKSGTLPVNVRIGRLTAKNIQNLVHRRFWQLLVQSKLHKFIIRSASSVCKVFVSRKYQIISECDICNIPIKNILLYSSQNQIMEE